MSNRLHDKVFEFCEEYRASHRDFLYWLRERNTKNRLEEGIWFQGTENYAFVGLYDRSGGSNMTRSIGLVFGIFGDQTSCSFENVFNEEQDSSVLTFYSQLRELVGGLSQQHLTKYSKLLSETDGFTAANIFLEKVKPQIDNLVIQNNLESLFIKKDDFEDKMRRVQQYKFKMANSKEIKYILVNISWNSNDWKGISNDKSGHRWVNQGNIPHESWNFDFDNPRNTQESVFGYCQFTYPPKVESNKNLIVFYSQNQIVGFYGNAEVLEKEVNINAQESYNLIGARPLCIFLNNKISDIKEKGYLEDKMRVGQVGFIYLQKQSTIISIIKEALSLNPDESFRLNALSAWLNLENEPEKNGNIMDTNHQSPLNLILFGPPGTGKTYHTITESVKIIDPEYFKVNNSNRDKLQDRFNDLLIKDWEKPEGQISFCTFHQSFNYEDFVEGIKPLKPEKGDTSIKYDIINGIFKKICRLADASNNAQLLVKENMVSLTQAEFNKAIFYKLSLGDSTKDEDKEIYEYCVSNNTISIGFGASIDFTGKNEEQVNQIVESEKVDPFTSQAINYFKNYLKTGNYVVVSYGNTYIRALGKVIGEYEYKPDAEIRYKHFRKVEWLFKDVEIPVSEFYQKNLSQQTIYKLKSEFIIPSFFVRQEKPSEIIVEQKKFVLVIDEINRGNVSSIFGELITLIEPSKRTGKPEALEVVLPYSKERFTVPSNVYLIGTMNTADRSIESLDTALRRRFSFKEMMPNPKLISTEGKSKGTVNDIDLVKLLQKMNERIEKLIDKDHKIGHSYFLEVKNVEDLKLTFKDKVIPLLEEYFFGDFGKIGLVLGSSFIKKEEITDFDFAGFSDYDPQTEQDLRQRSVFKIKEETSWDYKGIYEPKTIK
jgi:hypothetical protein